MLGYELVLVPRPLPALERPQSPPAETTHLLSQAAEPAKAQSSGSFWLWKSWVEAGAAQAEEPIAREVARDRARMERAREDRERAGRPQDEQEA